MGPTDHGATLTDANGGVNWRLLPVSGAGLAAETCGLLGEAYSKPQKATERRQSDRHPRRKEQHAGAPHLGSSPRRRHFSVGEHVLVVRGGIDVQAGLVGVGARAVWWRRSERRVMPGAEVAKDRFGNLWVVNDRDNPHRVLADGTT